MLTPLRVVRQAITSASRQPLRRCARVNAVRWTTRHEGGRTFSGNGRHRLESKKIGAEDAAISELPAADRARKLPVVCPGCGAPSQTVEPDEPGFYGSKRARKATQKELEQQAEDEIFTKAVAAGLVPDAEPESPFDLQEAAESARSIPICDRCHYLLYQSRGNSIVHPSMKSIQQIIEESPHKRNHIYHVLDAADFPLSLIPNLINSLHLPRLRTQNRRSKTLQYIRGRTAEVSFIITRSDLLAPKKEQVDSLLPYLREVLRESLGRGGKNIRLGMVRCVSAHRGWWTKTVKEEIYQRGGAGWVVGKVNVGKSALFEVVFPKGRDGTDVNVKAIRAQEKQSLKMLPSVGAAVEDDIAKGTPGEDRYIDGSGSNQSAATYTPHGFQESELDISDHGIEDNDDHEALDVSTLLPPAQVETAFPRMPLVSALPGTTASPIRIPFGNGKGELIDLPGIERSSLANYVEPAHHNSLIMHSRVVPESHTIKPGQSLLLGGLIRITPKTDTELIVLAYPFVPIAPHITATAKAIAIQTGTFPDGSIYDGNVPSIATPDAKSSIEHAASVKLAWDVTKRRTGTLTDSAAGKQKTANLPFIIYGADILVEGMGWVELTCQVRRRHLEMYSEGPTFDAFDKEARKQEEASVPEVEVFSPKGKFIGVRRPMNAWVMGGPKKLAKHRQRQRPRQTISFQRRKEGGARGKKLAEAA